MKTRTRWAVATAISWVGLVIGLPSNLRLIMDPSYPTIFRVALAIVGGALLAFALVGSYVLMMGDDS